MKLHNRFLVFFYTTTVILLAIENNNSTVIFILLINKNISDAINQHESEHEKKNKNQVFNLIVSSITKNKTTELQIVQESLLEWYFQHF